MMIVLVWYSRRYYPGDIGRGADADHAGAARPTGAVLQNVPLLRATGWITVLIFVGFMTHTLTHMPVAVPAVIGVAAILFAQDYYYLKEHKPTAEERQHGVLAILEKDIEWPTLGLLPVPVRAGRRGGRDRPDREPGARARLAHRRDLRRARLHRPRRLSCWPP